MKKRAVHFASINPPSAITNRLGLPMLALLDVVLGKATAPLVNTNVFRTPDLAIPQALANRISQALKALNERGAIIYINPELEFGYSIKDIQKQLPEYISQRKLKDIIGHSPYALEEATAFTKSPILSLKKLIESYSPIVAIKAMPERDIISTDLLIHELAHPIAKSLARIKPISKITRSIESGDPMLMDLEESLVNLIASQALPTSLTNFLARNPSLAGTRLEQYLKSTTDITRKEIEKYIKYFLNEFNAQAQLRGLPTIPIKTQPLPSASKIDRIGKLLDEALANSESLESLSPNEAYNLFKILFSHIGKPELALSRVKNVTNKDIYQAVARFLRELLQPYR